MVFGPARLKAIYSVLTSIYHPRSGSSLVMRFAASLILLLIPSTWTSPPPKPKLFPSLSAYWMAGSANYHPNYIHTCILAWPPYRSIGLCNMVGARLPNKVNLHDLPCKASRSDRNRHVARFHTSESSPKRPGPSILLLSTKKKTPIPFLPHPDLRFRTRPASSMLSIRSKPLRRFNRAI